MEFLDPASITFTRNNAGMLDMIATGGKTSENLNCIQMFPLTDPERYISVVKSGGPDAEEAGVIRDLRELPAEQQKLVRAHIRFRYFVPEIEDVRRVEESAGLHEIELETERGPKTIFVQNPRESLSVTDDGIMIITDVEKCRYKISKPAALSPRAKLQLEKIIL